MYFKLQAISNMNILILTYEITSEGGNFIGEIGNMNVKDRSK